MRALGVPPSALGDGPYLDINLFSADSNYNWDGWITIGGPYVDGSFSTSMPLGSALQYSSRAWYRDFGAGGTFDVKVIHTLGFDVGIYSFQLDGREFARLDGWTGGPDIVNAEVIVATGVAVGPGRHRLEIVMSSANPGATGLKFYPAISGFYWRRTGRLPRQTSQAFPLGRHGIQRGQVIDLFPIMATGSTNWSNVIYDTKVPHLTELYTTGAQNAARWWDLDLVAGSWDIELIVVTAPLYGIYSVQLDGVTLATIDGYSAGVAYGVHKTARFNVPNSGTHRLALVMATKNGSSSNYYGDIGNLQLKQVSATAPHLPHRIVNWTAWWSSGDLNWDVLDPIGTAQYGGRIDSTGLQNAARWWEKDLAAGTWDFEMIHSTGSNRGIYSVRIDDVEVGTIDGYAGLLGNVHTILTGLRVPFSGTHKIGLVMATKNASSSGYVGTVAAFQMRRTA